MEVLYWHCATDNRRFPNSLRSWDAKFHCYIVSASKVVASKKYFQQVSPCVAVRAPFFKCIFSMPPSLKKKLNRILQPTRSKG